jgi:hypothetical protein
MIQSFGRSCAIQNTVSHYSPVIIAPFVDKFIAPASRKKWLPSCAPRNLLTDFYLPSRSLCSSAAQAGAVQRQHATTNTPKSPPPAMLCRERTDARTTTFVGATAQDVKGKRSSLCDARRIRTCEVVHPAIDLTQQSGERVGKTRHSPLAADRN